MDKGDEIVDLHVRRRHEVVSSRFEGRSRALYRAAGREQDDGDIRTQSNPTQQVQPVAVRHHHVSDDEIGPFVLEAVPGFFAVTGLENLEASIL